MVTCLVAVAAFATAGDDVPCCATCQNVVFVLSVNLSVVVV